MSTIFTYLVHSNVQFPSRIIHGWHLIQEDMYYNGLLSAIERSWVMIDSMGQKSIYLLRYSNILIADVYENILTNLPLR